MSRFVKNLLLCIVAINLIAGLALVVYRQSLKKRLAEWTVKQVLERGRGELPHGFLAEALDLSQDRPTAWDAFSTREAEKKLMRYPFFEKVSVRKIEPNAVLVDYVLRTPVAKVADFSGQAIDNQGVMFPLEPYYSPKKLPAIRFGGVPRESKTAFFLLELLQQVERPPRLLLIDLAEQESSSLGARKIVVVMEELLYEGAHVVYQPILLQLPADEPLEGIERWKRVRGVVLEQIDKGGQGGKHKGVVVDLRQPHLAYLKK